MRQTLVFAALTVAIAGCQPAQTPPTAEPPAAPASAPTATTAPSPTAPATPTEPTAATDSTVPVTWQCGDVRVSTSVDVDTLTLTGGFGERVLAATPAASGARYADTRGTEFWNQGDGATLTLDGVKQPDCVKSAQATPWDAAKARGASFRAVGNEPGWVVEVGAGASPSLRAELDFGTRVLEVPAATKTTSGFSGTAADGSSVELTTAREPCTDDMSGERFPASATLKVGDDSFSGCGRFLTE